MAMQIRLLTALTGCLLLAGCNPEAPSAEADATSAEPVTNVLAHLESGWNTIAPGDATICSDGSTYRFFVRPADPDRLVVYFQGGGACWSGDNCDPDLDPSYKATVSEDEPARYRGIFEFDNPQNPFADYSFVMAPYCTADVHLGDSVATYQGPAAEDHEPHLVTIHHHGLGNAQAALDWTYAHFTSPDEIFVTGSSAGAIPSPYFAWKIADHYPNAHIAQLGDAAGGYRRTGGDTGNRLTHWGTLAWLTGYPEFAGITEADFNYEKLYIAAAQRHQEILFAEYDAAEDAVQKRFLAMSGNDTATLRDSLLANHADIRAAVGNFRAYVAGGDTHTILARPEFYTYQVNGERIRDWVADLANFETVDDIVCESCAEPELVEGATAPVAP